METEHNLGPQPIIELLEKYKLNAHDLVVASTEQITHKMVSRACKGRKLSRRVQLKIRNAVNAAADADYTLKDLFTY
ncbi:MAG: hypothetical protein J7K65_04880 [Planctomycetes bacterium]|nr:hypothetical protein [Planctomycetota bacterium]